MLDIVSVHKKLLLGASLSGSEGSLTSIISELAKPLCDEIRLDVLGNLICRKKGRGKKIAFSAHTDCVGFTVRDIDENGFVYVAKSGGVRPYSLIGNRVLINGVPGTVRLIKQAEKSEKAPSDITADDLYIDIGENARGKIKIGDAVIFSGELVHLGKSRIMTPYADDLLGCAVLLCAMEQSKQSKNDLYFIFTAQEEVGCRGAQTAAFEIEPEIYICADVCVSGDTPDQKDTHNPVKLGAGAALKISDGSAVCSRGLTGLLAEIAGKLSISVQKEISPSIGTDTSAFMLSKSGCAAAGVSLPIRNLHTPCEIYDLSDALSCVSLISAFAKAQF